jgi:Flagellar hook capping protein
MSDLVQPVKNGEVQQTSNSSTTKKSSGSNLDKDAFLQLLTTQMKYQDPLNPSSNTEYVAQLATFSQLEQIQNLSNTTSNSQAFSLVGKNVVIKNEDTAGKTSYISGTVDFVNITGGKAQVSVNGSLYSLDQLDSIIDDTYIKKQNLPGIKDPVTLKYDGENPTDLSFKVNLGSGDSTAETLAIAVNGTIVDPTLVSLSGNTVTIKKAAFKDLENGTYKVSIAFNDPDVTVVKDKLTVQVQNAVTTDDTPKDTSGTANNTNGGSTTNG